MTTLFNNNKTIQFSLTDQIKILKEANVPATYSLEMPTIICSDIDDALKLQKEINIYINNLINNKMKQKE